LLADLESAERSALSPSKSLESENPPGKRALTKRLMGLEPTTFCMAIVCDFRINAC
jgi:hypothetical protein